MDKRRYHATNDPDKKSEIGKEYQLEKRKIDIFDFWKSHEGNLNQFLTHFGQYIHTAATGIVNSLLFFVIDVVLTIDFQNQLSALRRAQKRCLCRVR